MLVNRFQEYFESELVASNAAPLASAFVLCPVMPFMAAQQAYIQEVYRLAAELTQEQLRPSRIPQFSMN